MRAGGCVKVVRSGEGVVAEAVAVAAVAMGVDCVRVSRGWFVGLWVGAVGMRRGVLGGRRTRLDSMVGGGVVSGSEELAGLL